MDRPKPSVYADYNNNSTSSRSRTSVASEFMRNNDPNNNNNNNNSTSSRSRSSATSFADFMRNNDPNNNNSSSSRGSYKSSKPHSAAVPLHQESSNMNNGNNNNTVDLRADYFRQQSGPAAEAAMFAVASYSSSSTSNGSSHNNKHLDRYNNNNNNNMYGNYHSQEVVSQRAQTNYLLQPKDPPRYDSRPNLKNDMSDSYQTIYGTETNEASHERSNYALGNNNHNSHSRLQQQQQPKQHHVETTASPRFRKPVLQSGSISSPSRVASLTSTSVSTNYSNLHGAEKPTSLLGGNNNSSTRSNNNNTGPRPSPRAGRPPASTTLPMRPGLPTRKLGRRGLLLGSMKYREEQRAPGGDGSGDGYHHNNSNHNRSSGDDPGPLQGHSTTITVECSGCGGIIEKVPKNAIALECPHCQKFFPTVTCRVMQ